MKKLSLTEGVIWKSLLSFAVPIMGSNLLQQLYNAVDSAVVGQFSSSQALAAVGSTGSLISLLVGLFLGIATGAGVIYANYYGAGDREAMTRTTGTSLVIGVIAGALLTVLGLLLSPALLRLMNTPEDVFDLADTYLRIYFLGTIPMLVYNIGAGIIRSGGDSMRPLLYLVISGLVNLVVDLVLVAGFDMGVAGAAWATVLSQVIAALLVLWHMMRMGPEEDRLRLQDLRLTRKTAALVLKVGIPCGLQSSMFNISNMLIQTKINAFGSVVMAGCAAYSRIDGFAYMPMMAMGLAISTYVGQNLGAGRGDRLKKGVRVAMVMSALATICVGVLILLFGRTLLTVFTTDQAVLDEGMKMLYIMAPTSWIFSFAEIYSGAIRGAGAAVPTVVINALTICVFRIIWLSVLMPIRMDIQLVYLCYPVSWVLCALVCAVYYYKGNWRHALGSVQAAAKAA